MSRSSRRAFLIAGGGAVVASAAGCDWFHREPRVVERGVLLGPCRYTEVTDGPQSYALTVINLDASEPEPKLIDLEFHAHGVNPDPTDAYRALLFEKHGPGACEVDLKSMKVVRPVHTPPERHFYGHGAWEPDGSLVYCTETVLADHSGMVVVRDGSSLKILGQFPTYGANPHDCRFVPGQRVLAITNGGGPMDGARPSVTYVDVDSRKLVERIEFEDPQINAGHLALSHEGDLAVVHAPREGLGASHNGAVSLRPAGGKLRTMHDPKAVTGKLQGETLSVAIHEPTGIVGATTPDANRVTFWDMDTGKLVKELELEVPQGIAVTLDDDQFLISYGPSASLAVLDAATLERKPADGIVNAWLSGSHLFIHALQA